MDVEPGAGQHGPSRGALRLGVVRHEDLHGNARHPRIMAGTGASPNPPWQALGIR